MSSGDIRQSFSVKSFIDQYIQLCADTGLCISMDYYAHHLPKIVSVNDVDINLTKLAEDGTMGGGK